MFRRIVFLTLAFLFVATAAYADGSQRRARTKRVRRSAKYKAFKKMVRDAFKVDRRTARDSVGIFVVLDQLKREVKQNPAKAAQLHAMIDQIAAVATQVAVVKGMEEVKARAWVGKLAEKAKAGETEVLVYKALVQTPETMKKAMAALHSGGAELGLSERVEGRQYKLGDHVDLDNVDQVMASLPTPKTKIEARFGDIARAGVANHDLSAAQARKNFLLAEVVHRLGENNHGAEGATKFAVTFNGERFVNAREFLEALDRTGHKIKVTYEHHNADFLKLRYVKGARSDADAIEKIDAGQFLNIGAALNSFLPLDLAPGQKAFKPVAHSEAVLLVDSAGVTMGTKVDGKAMGYAGVPDTGWFGHGFGKAAGWTGEIVASSVERGARAIKAATAFAYHAGNVNAVAKRLGLAIAAYGLENGVCNDSVAYVQAVMQRMVTGYPLMGADSTDNAFDRGLAAMANNRQLSGQDRAIYRDLADAAALLGRDRSSANANPHIASVFERVLASMPKKPAFGSERMVEKLLAQQGIAR